MQQTEKGFKIIEGTDLINYNVLNDNIRKTEELFGNGDASHTALNQLVESHVEANNPHNISCQTIQAVSLPSGVSTGQISAWAMEAKKPSYSIEEISGVKDADNTVLSSSKTYTDTEIEKVNEWATERFDATDSNISSQVSNLQATISQQKEEINANIASLQSNLEALTNRITTLEGTVDSLVSQITSLSDRVSALETSAT